MSAPLLIKREDISAEGYGGNKIRPLELVFADAQRRGARRIWATGSLGSNHAVATAVHRLRKRYGQCLRAEIAEIVVDPADVDDELRHMLAVVRAS